jgi:HEAT repeat protein
LKVWPELAKLLEELLSKAKSPYISSTAMTLLATNLRPERDRIITKLLAKDESWILHPSVYGYVHARRQDLLTPFLGHRTYKGRFSTGKVRHVLPFVSGFFRWNDAQRERFAKTLIEVAKKPKKKNDAELIPYILNCLRRLAAIPAIPVDALIEFARDTRPAIQETAVRALGRLDSRDGLPELVAALEDTRARWAIYAVRAILRDDSPEKLLEFLKKVSLRKVTVAKEVLRLAGELGGPSVLMWFAELHHSKLHRDVRGALLRSLWDHLESDQAWMIIEESALSPDVGVVIGLASIPTDRISLVARSRVESLMLVLLEHAEVTVRLAVLNRLWRTPVLDPKRQILAAIVSKFSSKIPDEQASALRAALDSATAKDAALFATATRKIMAQPRELHQLVMTYMTETPHRPHWKALGRAILAELETDSKLVSLQVSIAVAAYEPIDFAKWLVKLSKTKSWHIQSMTAVLAVLPYKFRSTAALETVEEVLANSDTPSVRWLAVRLLAQAGSLHGWKKARIDRLSAYGKDKDAMVAQEAAMIFPPDDASGGTLQ